MLRIARWSIFLGILLLAYSLGWNRFTPADIINKIDIGDTFQFVTELEIFENVPNWISSLGEIELPKELSDLTH
jgi:hypothetical protein